MNTRTTYILAAFTVVILGSVVGVGAILSQPEAKSVEQQTPKKKEQLPTREQLDAQLSAELPTISSVLTGAYPTIIQEYIIDRGKLYHKGEWYGTTLTYKGSDTDNRDTLRVLMQKKDSIWTVRSTPPVPILSSNAFADAPKDILKDINKPAKLPGTASSPEIIPTE